MRKLSAIISDFDDTLFFNKDSISMAAQEVYDSFKNKKDTENYERIMKGLETAIVEGKVPKGFEKPIKTYIYNLAYIKYSDKLIPNKPLINYLNDIKDENTEMIIMSARGEEFRHKTEEALLSNNLRFDKVILPKDHDLKDEHWKFVKLNEMADNYFHILFLEDKEKNIKYIMEHIKSDNIDFYLVSGKTLRYIPYR